MRYIFIWSFLFIVCSNGYAQQKIGYLNSADILKALPENKTMSQAIEKKKGEFNKILEDMYAEYQKKSKEVQEGGEITRAVLDLKVQQIKDLEKNILDFQQKGQDELNKYAQDIFKPLQVKFAATVKEVSERMGFSYVLDLAAKNIEIGGVVYYPVGTELDKAIKYCQKAFEGNHNLADVQALNELIEAAMTGYSNVTPGSDATGKDITIGQKNGKWYNIETDEEIK